MPIPQQIIAKGTAARADRGTGAVEYIPISVAVERISLWSPMGPRAIRKALLEGAEFSTIGYVYYVPAEAR